MSRDPDHKLHHVGGIPKVKEDDGKIVGMASADYFGEFARIMPYRVGGGNPPENVSIKGIAIEPGEPVEQPREVGRHAGPDQHGDLEASLRAFLKDLNRVEIGVFYRNVRMENGYGPSIEDSPAAWPDTGDPTAARVATTLTALR
mgnify:CR=1 FL=1